MTMNYASYSPYGDFMPPVRSNRQSSRGVREVAGDRDVDIADLLPSDPFGMNLSSTLTAFADLMRDLGAGSANYAGYEDYELYLGSTDGWVDGDWLRESLAVVTCEEPPEVAPQVSSYPEGMQYSLHYLGLQDLLAVECVCRTLRCAVQRDLPWKCLHVQPPLHEKINDSTLLSLAKRGNGLLQCLSLVDCSNITDDGLREVLEMNPRIEKLSVYGCRRLSIEGLIQNLKAFNLKALNLKASKSLDPSCKSSDPDLTGIKQLKLGKLFSLLPEHYEALLLILGCDPKDLKPRFFKSSSDSLACDDDRAIDVEMCPQCKTLKFVFGCPSERCQARGPDHCRACLACIMRCEGCGRCMKDCRYEETFLLQNVCRGCLTEQ